MKLQKRYLEKPWGRSELPAPFGQSGGGTTGEISFAPADDAALPLLLKFIFTSEKLSVQVHPDDILGKAKGYPHGKTECWYIIDAEPGSKVALGFTSEIDQETARSAATDGSIEDMLDWLPVKRGDFFHVPAGTVHAIGAGITLLEVQQNLDVTYRLYDYGRPRELHLGDALAAAKLQVYDRSLVKHEGFGGSQVLVSGTHFSVVRIKGSSPPPHALIEHCRWVVPIRGTASSGDELAETGDCMYLAAGAPLSQSEDALTLVAIAGPLE